MARAARKGEGRDSAASTGVGFVYKTKDPVESCARLRYRRPGSGAANERPQITPLPRTSPPVPGAQVGLAGFDHRACADRLAAIGVELAQGCPEPFAREGCVHTDLGALLAVSH